MGHYGGRYALSQCKGPLMKLTDISLNWLLPGAVLLLGMLAAVAVLARGKRSSGENASADDSWERSEERRRRKEAIYGTASYVLLFCCAAVAAALSFHGLVGFGEQNLGLTDGWQYLVPFGLDGAAMFCSVLAVREASHGDAALGSRILVWMFAAAAAWFNWVHAPRGAGHAGAPQFFSGMSLSAAVLFDRALKQTRRAALREQGLVPRPLPQIRIVRWLRAPRETYKAWSLMLLEGVRSLDEAVEEVREDKRTKDETRQRRREQHRLERAQLKAISRGHRGFVGRGARQVEVQAVERGSAEVTAEPAISTAEQLPVRARPSLQPVRSGSAEHTTVDLTAEDDTMALPRLDSLERKLKDLEQQFG
ncbi:membrane protein [Streptomyces alanosinicus]|uniref:Membrane protein n=2 Tax=Streptomyces alanosinicus TaxID=68171 RepID=A0A919D1L6_9ACTN|nr:membrane protein [Streptomyces alanosinicus]